MPIDFVLVQKIIAAVFVGYLLGSIPCAHIVARLRGRDIFSTGSTLAGTANVYWNIGRRSGALVFAGDVAKGASAVMVARLLEVPEHMTLAVAGAAILGHWKSIFSRFRGGDGMVTLMGLTIAMMEPRLALVGVVTGLIFVALLWRTTYRSAWGIVACFTIMLVLSFSYQMERGLVLGLTFLAAMVVLRSTLTQRRRGMVREGNKELDTDEDLDLDDDLDGDADFAPRNG